MYFATDAVKLLHRLGRTARAGREGHGTASTVGCYNIGSVTHTPGDRTTVTSIVDPGNVPLARAVLRAGGGSLEAAFSRRRSFRRRLKKAKEYRSELRELKAELEELEAEEEQQDEGEQTG